MRIANCDTLSLYFDRLITERIKWYFFVKSGNDDKAAHQKAIIALLRDKITETLKEVLFGDYECFSEMRTFDLLNNIENLTIFDLEIGESDRARLAEIQSDDPDIQVMIEQELRLRTANESRANTKNYIDRLAADMSEEL